VSVQFTLTGLLLECQYRLHSQVCRSSVSTVYTHRPAAQVSVQFTLRVLPVKCQYRLHSQVYRSSVSTGYIHRSAARLSVQFTPTGLPLECQYRLHSQVCRSSVSTVYIHSSAAQVSVAVTLTGVLLNMPIDITLTALPRRPDSYELHAHWNTADLVVFLASKGTFERVQHSSRVPVGLRVVLFYRTYNSLFINK
jgi:hypothetical protein